MWRTGGVSSRDNKKERQKSAGAGLEIAAIVNDWRAAVVGGFVSGLFLWEPFRPYNAGIWMAMSRKAER